ncbi:5-deoxy-glucuronate isomerase [Rhodovibrio sodomensis]|uniref:5-deoxy-glucuronate isomerase n=1 Tax=Rhodovibrio sodomensis TaxID=1088 RepID=A0ABS1DN20_9PROT|nr:5-deoxy-glucuronate isomerase [Rhodovibrio sodomensis]MBK1670760.1 5-deoxy-glucuronate isomerase [Rhodovibrio sodomensis]
MSSLLRRPTAPDAEGAVHRITPESAGWRHVGFDLHRLAPGQALARDTGDRELLAIALTGTADLVVDGADYPGVGDRRTLFDGGKPDCVYAPANTRLEVHARNDLELALCSAPGTPRARPARRIAPDGIEALTRGEGTNTRYIHNILPDSEPADSLIVVEVFTPAGHWSSYPPHKHDTDNPPEETQLEETYYHRLQPAGGFAFQRVYTDDGSIDQSMAVSDGDVVLVPCGYHPVGAPHGFQLYYLNVMAGPRREWRFTIAPTHRFLTM